MNSRGPKVGVNTFEKRLLIIVGGYGSGKSEVSINLAATLARQSDDTVTIADLDIVNPYFRSRNAAEQLSVLGVKSLIPTGEQFYADLPIILPEIKSAIEKRQGWLILDVGGDDTGSKVLSSLTDVLCDAQYEMLLVMNLMRPFTSTLEGCQKLIDEIESATRLKFTGVISNSHMLEETTTETILAGLELARRVCDATGLNLSFVSAVPDILSRLDKSLGLPVLSINRYLLKPWEQSADVNVPPISSGNNHARH